MATNFPTSKDDGTSLPYPTALSARTTPSLAGLSDNQNDAIIAVQNKLGISASTPTSSKLLIGTGAGSSAWTKTAPAGEIVGTTDSQTLTNKTFTSPTINSPIIENATFTSDLIQGYTTATSGTIYGIQIALGKINTALSLNSTLTVTGNTTLSGTLTTSGLTTATGGIATDTVTGISDSDTGTIYGISVKDGYLQNWNGWITPNETWEYVSVDDPTGIFRVNANVTTKYSVGMRIKFTNNGNTIYGIITVIGSYSGGYTSITFLHEINPGTNTALHIMDNSAITANYYSSMKCPFGFPIDTTKWSIIYDVSSNASQSSANAGTWYNLGNRSIIIPIGNWVLDIIITVQYGTSATSSGNRSILATYSTTNNADTLGVARGHSLISEYIRNGFLWHSFITLNSKTTLYFLEQIEVKVGTDTLYNNGIQFNALCGYL